VVSSVPACDDFSVSVRLFGLLSGKHRLRLTADGLYCLCAMTRDSEA
jgi:hypothetical protein